MKSRRQDAPLPYQRGETVSLRQYLDPIAHLHDAGCSNEDHLEWAAGQGSLFLQNGRIDLPSVSVALDHRIQHPEGPLRGMGNLTRQQNGSCTGGEDRLRAAEGAKFLEEVLLFQELQHRGRLAARKDQS